MLSAIVAVDRNHVIGYQNQMPWHLPADLQHFKAITMGHAIIMGRNTYDSLGKPLPGRKNIVITRRPLEGADAVIKVVNIADALKAVDSADEAFIIGGQQIYQQTLQHVQKIYLTHIEHAFLGDSYFPQLSELEWKIIHSESHAADERNPYAYTFLIMQRTRN